MRERSTEVILHFDFKHYSQLSLCPWTGQRIQSLAVHETPTYRIEFLLLGDRTLVTCPIGHCTLPDTQQYLLVLDQILSERMPDKKAILIEDYSLFAQSDLGAKSLYVQRMRTDARLERIVYVNPSRIFKLLIQMGPKVYKSHAQIQMADNFAEALHLSHLIEHKPGQSIPQAIVDYGPLRAQLRIPHPHLIEIKLLGSMIQVEEADALFDALHKFSTHQGFSQKDHVRLWDFSELHHFGSEVRKIWPESLIGLREKLPFAQNHALGLGLFKYLFGGFRKAFSLDPLVRSKDKKLALECAESLSQQLPQNNPHIDSILSFLSKINEGADEAEIFLQGISKEDEFRPVYEAIAFVRNDFSTILAERDAKEKEIIQAKEEAEASSEAKSRFLAHMSHELRTPLSGILGMTEILGQTELNEYQQDCVQTTLSSAKSLLDSLQKVLNYTELQDHNVPLNPEVVEIRPMIKGIVEVFAFEAKLRDLSFALELDDTLPLFLQCDPIKLRLILEHLLDNALKFTQLGFIGVRVSSSRESSNPDMLNLRLEVKDSGRGIEEQFLNKIFQPFSQSDQSYSRSFGGMGLGLAICHRTAELMGGEIHFDSQMGRGSTFILDLPVESYDQSMGLANDLIVDSLIQRSYKILLVEDNPINQKVALKTLEKMGHTVDLANHGHEALDLLASRKYDLVLMDVQMPIMDGLSATRAWRIKEMENQLSRTPIIALTAHALSKDQLACKEAGMDDYLTKPIQYKIFEKCLNYWASKNH